LQTSRILDDLSTQLAQSEASQSTAEVTRIGGTALEMRTAEFAMHAADPEEVSNDVLATEFAGTVVPATTEWPRSFVAVTTPTDTGAQYLYVLTQAEARAQYAMTSWTRLLAGVTLPETAPPDVGSPTLALGEEGDLAHTPQAALASYAEAKDNPASGAAGLFDGTDPARDAWVGLIERWGAALEPIEGTVAPASSADTEGAYVMATADGGAIVLGTIRSALTLTIPETPGRSFTLAPYFGALGAASTTVTRSATIEFAQPVALAIPPKASGQPVAVLGVAQVPVKATTE
jgi:hypothetical protein